MTATIAANNAANSAIFSPWDLTIHRGSSNSHRDALPIIQSLYRAIHKVN